MNRVRNSNDFMGSHYELSLFKLDPASDLGTDIDALAVGFSIDFEIKDSITVVSGSDLIVANAARNQMSLTGCRVNAESGVGRGRVRTRTRCRCGIGRTKRRKRCGGDDRENKT